MTDVRTLSALEMAYERERVLFDERDAAREERDRLQLRVAELTEENARLRDALIADVQARPDGRVHVDVEGGA